MILKNSKGKEKTFDVLLELEKNKQKYIVYKDPYTLNIYGGKLIENKIEVLEDEEFELLNDVMEKLNNEN